MKLSTPESRIFGFDFIRAISMLAIIQFHANEAVFWTDQHPLTSDLSLYGPLEFYGRSFSYSGFTIIALSFFLIGRSTLRNFLPLIGFLALGVFTLAAFQHDPPFQGFYWEWDIYWYLLAAVCLIQILSRMPRLSIALIPVWLSFTLFPVWNWLHFNHRFLQEILIGRCPPEGIGSWPLLPWIAWPLLFYSLGLWFRESDAFKKALSSWQRREILIWAPLLLLSLPQWGAFYETPIGPGFYCHTLRQPPVIFWSHFIWVLFFMRLSLVRGVNKRLSESSLFRFISGLMWSRAFGLCYLLHLVLLGFGILARPVFLEVPFSFDLYWLSLFPATELLARAIKKLLPAQRKN